MNLDKIFGKNWSRLLFAFLSALGLWIVAGIILRCLIFISPIFDNYYSLFLTAIFIIILIPSYKIALDNKNFKKLFLIVSVIIIIAYLLGTLLSL